MGVRELASTEFGSTKFACAGSKSPKPLVKIAVKKLYEKIDF